MKKKTLFILYFIFILSSFNFTMNSQSKNKEETVNETEKGIGEDELITDDEGEKKRKNLKKPESIGLLMHDQYTDAVWDYYQKSKELTELANFIKVELVETGDTESEFTTDIIITNGLGEDVTWENAMKQFKAIEKNLKEQEKQSDKLTLLSNKATEEKVPFKKMGKSAKLSLKNSKIQAIAIAEIGKTLYNVGKNIATLIKIRNLTRKQ
ncbi:MAG: hypothetical protein ACWA45_04550 [Flavobacteriales bacterium]